MLRSYIDHCWEPGSSVFVENLQIGAIHWQQWHSWKVNEHPEVVLATFGMGEHVRTTGRQAGIVIVSRWELESVTEVTAPAEMKRVHWQGPKLKEP